MAGFIFEFKIGKGLGQKLDESFRAIGKIQDRVRRTDLETEARLCGSLLAALATAERALRDAPEIGGVVAAADAYVGKVERAATAVHSIHERACGAAAAVAP